jgi:hemerythrin superfamily protein
MSAANESRVTDAIKHDHAELKEYYDNILGAKDSDSKVRWQNQFVWELARHSIGEELVVYPAMEKHMGPEGKEMADKDRTEHNKVSRRHGIKADPSERSWIHHDLPHT